MELLIDGVRYKLWMPQKEEDLESMVKEHAKDIFGKDSIYFDIKQKIRSKAGIGSIPDGYVITFEGTPRWYVVEVESSSHPLYEHIVPQMTKFSTGINDLSTQRAIVDTFYGEINSDIIKQTLVKNKIGSREIHEFLAGLISSPPILVIVIEEKTKELEEVCSNLRLETKVVEFKTLEREGVGLAVHAHLFESLYEPRRQVTTQPEGKKKKEEVTIQDLLSADLVRADQMIFKDHKGKRYEAKILPSGNIRVLYDGTEWRSLSMAAVHITQANINGWKWWHTIADGGKILMDVLRDRYVSL